MLKLVLICEFGEGQSELYTQTYILMFFHPIFILTLKIEVIIFWTKFAKKPTIDASGLKRFGNVTTIF